MSWNGDYVEIVHLFQRYAWSLDGQEWDALASCFAPDGELLDLWNNPLVGPPAIVAFLQPVWTSLTTQHITSPPVVEWDGDTATAKTYFLAQHIRTDWPEPNKCLVGGFYEDVVVKKSDGWKIARRHPNKIWSEGNMGIFSVAAENGR